MIGDQAARDPVSIAPATSDARRGGFLTEWNDTLAPFIHHQSRLPDPLMPASIEAESLTKKFGDFVADDSVSFSVSAGETYGLLGPNGAGKTTLVRLLTTLLSPTSGTARIRGHDIVREKSAVRASIGTVSQAVTTDENLTAAENLSVQGKMYGLWGRDLSRRIARRLSQVGLEDRRNQVTRDLGGSHLHGEAWIDQLEVTLERDALLLLCSDGLPNAVGADELFDHLRRSRRDGSAPEELADALIVRALERGARDNVTAVVVRQEGDVPLPRRRRGDA